MDKANKIWLSIVIVLFLIIVLGFTGVIPGMTGNSIFWPGAQENPEIVENIPEPLSNAELAEQIRILIETREALVDEMGRLVGPEWHNYDSEPWERRRLVNELIEDIERIDWLIDQLDGKTDYSNLVNDISIR